MLRTLVITLVVARGGSQAQRIPVDPPAPLHEATAPVEPAPVAAAPATAPTLDEPAVLAQSHAWFDASDRFDSAAVAAAMGPTFVLFADARFLDKDQWARAGVEADGDWAGMRKTKLVRFVARKK